MYLYVGVMITREETILKLTWHEVQDTELHAHAHKKGITLYDIIYVFGPSYNKCNNNEDKPLSFPK